MGKSAGSTVLVLSEDISLSEGADLASNQAAMVHGGVLGRGKSNPAGGQRVVLLTDGLAQGAAESTITVVDDYERGDLVPYTELTAGTYSVTNSSSAPEGSWYIQTSSNNEWISSLPGDGLPYYPTRGDIIEWNMFVGGSETGFELDYNLTTYDPNDSGFAASLRRRPEGSTDGSGNDNSGLRMYIDPRSAQENGTDEFRISDYGGAWYPCRLENGAVDMTFRVYEPGNRDNELGNVTLSDDRWDGGGIGWDTSQSSGTSGFDQRGDYIRKVGEI